MVLKPYEKSKVIRKTLENFSSDELKIIAELILEVRDSNFRGLQKELNEVN